MERDEEMVIEPDEERPWKPGDPCGMCGSTATAWSVEPYEGAICFGCGGMDYEG